MTRIYLLRHGATASNGMIPYRLQGRRADGPLASIGEDQARRAAEVLQPLAIDAVYASPLLRSLRTAEIIGEPHGLTPEVRPLLIEAELGRWEGLTWDEARDRDPEQFRRFMDDPGTTPYPDGESFLDVQRRVAPELSELAARHPGGKVVVVGHNVVNRAYLAGILGLPISKARGIRQANGGVNVIEYDGETPTIVSLNASLHLESVDAHR